MDVMMLYVLLMSVGFVVLSVGMMVRDRKEMKRIEGLKGYVRKEEERCDGCEKVMEDDDMWMIWLDDCGKEVEWLVCGDCGRKKSREWSEVVIDVIKVEF